MTFDDNAENNRTPARLAWSLNECAAALGVSVPFLRLEIARKRLRPTRLGRRVLVTRAELERYIEGATSR